MNIGGDFCFCVFFVKKLNYKLLRVNISDLNVRERIELYNSHSCACSISWTET